MDAPVPDQYLSIHEALAVLFVEMFPGADAENLFTLPELGTADNASARLALGYGLRKGEVSAFVKRSSGAIDRISAEWWKDDIFAWRAIAHCKVRVDDEPNELAPLVRESTFSLWARERAQKKPTPFPIPEHRVEFDDSERFTLYQAAVLIGSRGQGENSSVILRGDWLDLAANDLIAALGARNGLTSGINPQTMLREPIPRTYWEKAAYSPSTIAERKWHLVDLIEPHPIDPSADAVFGGTLTPVGSKEPRWITIEVPRTELTRLLQGSGLAANVRKQTSAGERKCQLWLAKCMRESPNEPRPKAELKRRLAPEFGVSGRAFERAWTGAVSASGADRWGYAGRRKKQI